MTERYDTPGAGARRHRGGLGSRLRRRLGSRLRRLAVPVVAGAVAAFGLPASALAAGTSATTNPAAAVLPHAMGLVPTSQPAVSAAAASGVRAAGSSLPASVDLTKYAMPVGNQGAVGSCASWATTYSALGYWINKQGIAGGALAPMYAYSQNVVGNDQGSSIEGNLYTAEQEGIDNQSDYWQGNYDWTDVPNSAQMAHAVNWKLSKFTGLLLGGSLTQQSIQTALAGGDPVVIGISVYNNFFYVGSNGLYSGVSGSFAGYHAITALGYNSNGLVIENSWGTGWGAAGYATLSWSFVNTYVFDAVAIGPLATGQPVSGTAPTVSGTAHQGMTLTASNGSWSPSATSYSYQWEHAGAGSGKWIEISGATSSSYVPAASDVGDSLRVLVTAKNGSGPGAAFSAGTATVPSGAPANTVAPSISGTLRQGQTLTVSNGGWNPAATSYAYQWQRSTNAGSTWTAISAATGSTYVPGSADVNANLRVLLTATNASGQASATSAQAGPINGEPYNTAVPAVSGTVRQGQTLTASSGAWNPTATSYAYQWQRSTNSGGTWTAITNATSSTYALASADVGATVRMVVTAANSYGHGTGTSAAVGPIASAAPVNTVAPTVTGTPARGTALTVSQGTWSQTPTSYTYQWQRSTNSGASWANISGASSSTYTPVVADEKAQLRAMVTGINAYGQVSAASAATKAVAAVPPVNTTAPSITGTASAGSTVTANSGAGAPAGSTFA